jgi:hypothetical protein
MKMNQHFSTFYQKISIDDTRKSRIENSISHLKNFVDQDDEVKEVIIDLYCQGSYAIETGIKPVSKDGEFDVDIILVLNLDSWLDADKKPQAVLKWLCERMKTDGKWQGQIKSKSRCVRITYAGDFHLDVVPALLSYGNLIVIPDKQTDEWVPSNPKGYIEWFDSIDPEHKPKIRDMVKILKYWRDRTFGKKSSPKSILLTTLVGMNYAPGYSSRAETLTVSLENLSGWLSLYSSPPTVYNPSMSMGDEDLARFWTDETFNIFQNRIESAAKIAREALGEQDLEKSHKIWSDLFPGFPTDISKEAKQYNEAKNAEHLFIGSTGALFTEKVNNVRKVYRHTFYGGDDHS